ncbi:hypothetical protein [Gordonia sp. (in: high G+C Gram-positive bacteria)]|uniref:hypothetical protein n=1 Tax=Gordonia sp. (in: high G+C Gram-positive bacteria) TaxID=84139 RepID=UPI003C7835E3
MKNSTRIRTTAAATAATALLAGTALAGSADAQPATPGGNCAVDERSAQTTIHSLMDECSSSQIVELFKAADAGQRPPAGKYRLYLLPVQQSATGLKDYASAKNFVTMQSKLGDALHFTTGPQGQPWVHKEYITGLDAGAPVHYAPRSFADREPVWTADFVRDFAGISVSTHEYRQLTPTVWIGRDFLGPGTATAPPKSGGAMAFTAY